MKDHTNSAPNKFRRTAEELSKEMDVLQKQLFNAKAHFDVFMGLIKSSPKYSHVFNCSLAFWNLTVQAHGDMALSLLSRIYDQNDKSIHLPNFLKAVEQSDYLFNVQAFKERISKTPGRDVETLASYERTLNREQLESDKFFCSGSNPSVKSLIIWRNNVISHFSYEHLVADPKPFHEKYPIPFDGIEELLSRGFSIINYYSGVFRASQHSENFLSHQKSDYLFVLESIQSKLIRSP